MFCQHHEEEEKTKTKKTKNKNKNKNKNRNKNKNKNKNRNKKRNKNNKKNKKKKKKKKKSKKKKKKKKKKLMMIQLFLVHNSDLVDLHTSIHRSVAVKPAFLHLILDANPSHRINDEAWRPPCDVRVGRCWKHTFFYPAFG